MADGIIIIDTDIDTAGFNTGMGTMQKRASGLSGAFKKLGIAIGAAFAVGKLVAFGKEAIELGSDLQEVQNVVDVTFTTMNEQVNEFARNAAEAAGLSETMAKRYVGTFGAMSKSFGFAESEAYEMSTALTQLTGDVASFYNITQDEAYTKLKSVFTGETESLKDLGVVMTQTALDAYALANGFGKTTKQMTEQEKVALRYRFVLDQLSGASGDFVRTSDSWANQIRVLKLNFDSLKATIGQGLINFLTPVVKVINTLLSKLATLANAFKSFSELVMGTKTSDGGTKELAEGYGEVASGIDDYTSATEDATKANEKFNNSLSGYDKLNSLSKKDGSPSASLGGVPMGEPVDYGSLAKGTDEIEEQKTALDAVKNRFLELADLFKQGFNLGFVDTDFQSILDNMERIKTALFNIFNSPEVKAAISRFVNNFVYSLGQITGALASIGVTIATNITGGIAKYLEDNTPRIKEYIVNMFDIGSEFMLIAGQLATTLASIFTVFDSEVGQSITANLIAMVINPFMAVTQLLASLVTDLLGGITAPIVENAEEIKTALYGLLEIVEVVTGSIAGFWTNIGDSFLATYNEHIKPAIDNVSAGLSELLAVGLELWNEWVQPFIKDTAEKISGLMDKYINPFVSKAIKFGGQIVEIISLVWKKWLVPLWSWIAQNLIPVFTKLASHIVDNFNYVGQQIGVIVNMAMDILNGLAEFIAGVLTDDFERAGNGIRDIFKGVINGIIEFFENGINFIVKNLNKLKFTVPDWIPEIGGESIGFNLSRVSIPRLATGAVIPPNREFLAVLGDQKHGTNIETPLDTMIDAFKQAIKEMGGVGNNGQMHVTVEIDGRVLGQTMVDLNNQSKAITGKPLLT